MVAALLLTITTAITCGFFLLIGKRHIGVVPILFRLFFLGNSLAWEKKKSDKYKVFFKQYGLFISRIIILIGLGSTLLFLQRDTYTILLSIMSLNIIAYIVSLIQKYKDGTQIFHRSYRLTTLVLLTISYIHNDLSTLRQVFQLIIACNVGLYACIYFLIAKTLDAVSTQEQKNIKEILIVLTHTMFISTIIALPEQIYHGLFGAQIYISAVFAAIYYLQKQQASEKPSAITANDILAGQRVLEHESHNYQSLAPRILRAQRTINQTSIYTKHAFSILNIITIIVMFTLFRGYIGKGIANYSIEIVYRLSIGLFAYNFLMIKKINFSYKIQRVFVFFLINFAIYMSLINLLGEDIIKTVGIAVLWNIGNSIAIFYSHELQTKGFMKYHDYYYRIAANIIATILNIILINKIPDLHPQLNFALITFYLGIQGFLMYYNISYVKELSTNN